MENLLNVLLNKRKEWTLYEDAQLRLYLKDRTSIYQNSLIDFEKSLDELNTECEQLSLRLETIHSNVSALKFIKSIEECVADVTPPESVTEESTSLNKDDDDFLTQKVIDEGLKFVSKHFNEVNSVFKENETDSMIDPIYKIKDLYSNRPLPEMIGSDAFFNFKMNEKEEPILDNQTIENIIPNFEQKEQILNNSVLKSTSPTPSTSKNSNDLTQILVSKNIEKKLSQKETIPQSNDDKTTQNQILSEDIIYTNNQSFKYIEENCLDNTNNLICKSKSNINTILTTQINKKNENLFDEKILTTPKFYEDNLKTNILLPNKIEKNLQNNTHQNNIKVSNSKLNEKFSKSLFSSSSSENEENTNKNDFKNILNERLNNNIIKSQIINKTNLKTNNNTLITDKTEPLQKPLLIAQNTKENDSSFLSSDSEPKLSIHKRTKGPMRRAPSNVLKSQSTIQEIETKQCDKQDNLIQSNFENETKVKSSINNITTKPIDYNNSSLSESTTTNITNTIKSPDLLTNKNNTENTLKIKASIFDSSSTDEDLFFNKKKSTSKIDKKSSSFQQSHSIETNQSINLNMINNKTIVSKQKKKKSLFDDSDSDF